MADFQRYDFQCDFLPFSKLTRFRRKSGAKVLLFSELTKFLGRKNAEKHHFLYKSLKINIAFFTIWIHWNTTVVTIEHTRARDILLYGRARTYVENGHTITIEYISVRFLPYFSKDRDIHRVFVEYSWGIHMYRVCVGYVSGMRRVCVETNKSIQCLLKTVKVIYWKTRIKICKYKKKTVPLQGILGIGY